MASERPFLTQALHTGRRLPVRISPTGAFGLKSLSLALVATAFAGCQSITQSKPAAIAPASVTGAPVTEAPVTEAPVTEAPVAQVPGAQEAMTDGPIDLSQAHWTHLPNGAQIAGLYPAEAAKTKQGGFALVHCQVKRSGDLQNCEALIEHPAGFGFGDATVQAAKYFKLAAGAYGPNTTVDVPFQWKLR
jgi:TonB family protein